ncbi:hypothetical protein [Chitinolyticbacter albus]|uniref:hypothetical protein n=1 Tax=Chitinolyticbacter albus TaxID=2961951 RepID=UPI00210967D2|nr:hypothetical protein [Chitinolyticbacter albus]
MPLKCLLVRFRDQPERTRATRVLWGGGAVIARFFRTPLYHPLAEPALKALVPAPAALVSDKD